MKKILGILVLGLLVCNVGLAESTLSAKKEIDLIPFMRRLGKLDESNINILTITRQGG